MTWLAEITPSLFYFVAIINALMWLDLLIIGVGALTKPSFWPRLKNHLVRFADVYAFAVALLSTLGSLWLSDIAGITPCKLCWLQRICMYPLVAVLGVAVWKNHGKKKRAYSVRAISLILAGVGAIIAGYHYALQRSAFLQQTVPCQATADCSTMYLGYWGFYSIPLMAFTAFVMIFVLQWAFARKG